MALQPNWIDIAGQVYASQSGQRIETIVKDGNTLWGTMLSNNVVFHHIAKLYKSTDAGVTWIYTGLDVGGGDYNFAPDHDSSSMVARSMIVFGRELHYFLSTNGGRIFWSVFDLDNPTNPWTGWQKITGNYDAGQFNGGTLVPLNRNDRDILLAFTTFNGFTGFYQAVGLMKYSSGSWSNIGTVGDGTRSAYLAYGMVDPANGNAHIFFHDFLFDFDTGFYPNFAHFSVAYADDAVSSSHILASNVDLQFGWGSPPVGSGDIKGMRIVAPFGDQLQDQLFNHSSYGTLKVAFGDTSGDPLNPTWSVSTVNATPDFTLDWSGQNNQQCQAYIDGLTPWVYYATSYPSSFSPYPNWRLWRSSYVSGAWTTPELWYDPADTDATLDPLRASNFGLNTLTNFQLVKGFSSGVGIQVDVENVFAGYSGPPLVTATRMVSVSGPAAGPGRYAAVG